MTTYAAVFAVVALAVLRGPGSGLRHVARRSKARRYESPLTPQNSRFAPLFLQLVARAKTLAARSATLRRMQLTPIIAVHLSVALGATLLGPWVVWAR